jgi:large subunit ribosomal protein L6
MRTSYQIDAFSTANRYTLRRKTLRRRIEAMSRVGKRPVPIPSGVTASVEGQTVKMKGPKGQLQFVVHDDVEVKFESGEVKVAPRLKTNRAQAMYGTARAQVANLVEGVTKGFEKKLEITGVGYRAALQGKNLQLALGYSHDVVYAIPEGITIVVPKPTEITITGTDSQRVGQVAAEIRAYRPPEPYKGKGVKYANEFIFRKEGKKK